MSTLFENEAVVVSSDEKGKTTVLVKAGEVSLTMSPGLTCSAVDKGHRGDRLFSGLENVKIRPIVSNPPIARSPSWKGGHGG